MNCRADDLCFRIAFEEVHGDANIMMTITGRDYLSRLTTFSGSGLYRLEKLPLLFAKIAVAALRPALNVRPAFVDGRAVAGCKH